MIDRSACCPTAYLHVQSEPRRSLPLSCAELLASLWDSSILTWAQTKGYFVLGLWLPIVHEQSQSGAWFAAVNQQPGVRFSTRSWDCISLVLEQKVTILKPPRRFSSTLLTPFLTRLLNSEMPRACLRGKGIGVASWLKPRLRGLRDRVERLRASSHQCWLDMTPRPSVCPSTSTSRPSCCQVFSAWLRDSKLNRSTSVVRPENYVNELFRESRGKRDETPMTNETPMTDAEEGRKGGHR